MKKTVLIAAIVLPALLLACDVQSGMTKKSLERYQPPTPLPSLSPEPPIDPAEVVTADTSQTGPQIAINKTEEGKVLKCDKYNKVVVNGDDRAATITGACRQIMINGDRAKVNVEAVSEIVLNGSENVVNYAKYLNGKRPAIVENAAGNTIEKIAQLPARVK